MSVVRFHLKPPEEETKAKLVSFLFEIEYLCGIEKDVPNVIKQKTFIYYLYNIITNIIANY